MSTGSVNNKSVQLASRVPHEVAELLETTRKEGESVGRFIATAIKNEAERRQHLESDTNQLLSDLNDTLKAFKQIEDVGTKIGTDLQSIVATASNEIKRRQRKAKASSEQ
ncbi:hypothetical protein HGO23_19235 [Xenorhabdus budapestensis]|uniref:Uncharacterized protein n=1 Tax=Xenorhabdus budapestensis TaxID=290110 RepID=A0ABX7VK06_XENBU|nr:YlcI/YnfO family protein [Xenorhabdus budapestensis]QTL39845.1 hypothetical protein HGO23_19235 [Xenorhabdus budapestensis]